jgi:hypothetical protein
VETGTYYGEGARRLARIFPSVVTIELSDELFTEARIALANHPQIEPLHGDSRDLLRGLVDDKQPTLYFLDGHWSGGPTAGAGAECPVLDEIAALRGGHANDCVLIDDARLFTAPPPPPHDPAQWPTLLEVLDALRAGWQKHHITLLADLVIAVPAAARAVVDRFGQALHAEEPHTSRRRRSGLTALLAGRFR